MRKTLRLLPLPLGIALSLSAHAADDPVEDWSLCPIVEAVPAIVEPPRSEASEDEDDAQSPFDGDATTVDGQEATNIDGDDLDGTEGGVMNLSGNVFLRRGDQRLLADRLSFDQETETYTAEGSVRYQDGGMRLIAARASGDQAKDIHKLEDIKYQLISRHGNGGAESIEMKGDVGTLHRSTYSTCPPDARWWELRAQRIDVDTEQGMGTARNATLHIGKVPVLYLPWFRFPTDDRRRTGLLYPAISSSGRNGFDWRQPIYFNLAPNYDATLTPRLMTKRGLQLGGEFRYLTEHGRGVVEAAFLPSDDLTDRERDDEIAAGIPEDNRRASDRGMFRFNATHNIGAHWQARSQLGWISDTRYLDDSSNALNGASASFVASDIGLYGRGRHWQAGVAADHWQLADYTLRDNNLPFDRLPRVFGQYERPIAGALVAGIDAEAVRFDHTELTGGSRLDLQPYLSLPLEGPSWFIRPTIAWRYTGYKLEGEPVERAQSYASVFGGPVDAALIARFADDAPNRSLPIATLDAGLFFDRQTRVGDQDYLHTLEPRIFYFNAPYREQSGIPLFDSRPLTFGWGQLFRDNRYAGADRQADGNQLTLAVSSRLYRQSDGLEKFSASFGQIHYFEDSRVVAPGEQPIAEGKSAWIIDTNYAATDRWTLGASYQWDPEAGKRDLASLRSRYLIGDKGIFNFGYRYRRDLLEQVDLSFLYPVNPNWSLVGRYYYSLQDKQLLEGIAGVQWESCCLAVRLVTRRYLRNRTGDLNDAIQLEIELKGLGSAGPDTESRLRRAILGYYREDLSLVPPAETRTGGDNTALDPAP